MGNLRLSVGLMTVFYIASYVPYMVLTRAVSTVDIPQLGRPLSGLETLPPVVGLGSVMLILFIWKSGWWRSAHTVSIMGFAVPCPTRWTALSAVGTSLLLITVPLSLTFKNVSIPFMQLIMRGDVLLLAPAIDLIFGRRVRWYSWAALGIVGVALFVTMFERGGLNMPPLAIVTLILYTLGYCIRLAVMTKVAKNSDPDTLKSYFVEEKIVALPLGMVLLWVLQMTPLAKEAGFELGFFDVWTSETILPLLGMATCWFIVAIASAIILLGPQENSFCVPLERSASIIAGSIAAFILAGLYSQPYPTLSENIGTGLLVGAIVLLSLAPAFSRKTASQTAVTM